MAVLDAVQDLRQRLAELRAGPGDRRPRKADDTCQGSKLVFEEGLNSVGCRLRRQDSPRLSSPAAWDAPAAISNCS